MAPHFPSHRASFAAAAGLWSMSSTTTTPYLTATRAAALDADLMSVHGFSLDQLMELAGLAVACATIDAYPDARRPLVICGPGNNGGDGLVAARHLAQFGLTPSVIYPLPPKKGLYERLLMQCRDVGVPVYSALPDDIRNRGVDLAVDAMFGFSFHGALRAPFDALAAWLNESGLPCVAVDVPSGMVIDQERPDGGELVVNASVLVSLSAPKLCSRTFPGRHYLGGRFLPPALVAKFDLGGLPPYPGDRQFVLISDTQPN